MNFTTTNDVTERLKALPDLRPPTDAWERIRTRQKRDRRRIAWPVTAAAAAAAALVAVAFLADPIQQLEPAPVESLIVRDDRAAASESSDVRRLQSRSRQIEQMLHGLPPPAQIVHADTAGAIVELEDRIAAVDYELNMAALKRATGGAVPPGRSVPGAPQGARVLWQRRVELMGQLLQVRYAEAGATPF